MLTGLDHDTSQSQMPMQISHSHCHQSAFVPSHLEKLLYLEGVLHVAFDKHVQSKLKLAFIQAVKYFNSTNLATNGTYADPVSPNIDNLDKL